MQKANTQERRDKLRKDVWNKCENCIYYGTAADAPETVEPECMWQPNEENGYDLPCVEAAARAAQGAAERVLEYGA